MSDITADVTGEEILSGLKARLLAAPNADWLEVPRIVLVQAEAEIRRLRAAIKKLNTCVECGDPNPQDNICEDCWKGIQDETV